MKFERVQSTCPFLLSSFSLKVLTTIFYLFKYLFKVEVIETKEEAQKRKESMFLAPTSKAPRPKTTFVEEDEEIPEPPDADNLLK